MNVRLRKTLSWLGSYVHQDQFNTNRYTVTLDLATVTANNHEQNVAYERLKFWFYDVMQDSIMIRDTHPDLRKWTATGARILCFPDDPVDQLVGIMLCLKLNAIMEHRIACTNVTVSSELGDDMAYLHSYQESQGPLAVAGWWSDSRPSWSSAGPGKKDKVISLDRSQDWKQYDLDWHDTAKEADDNVVFARFEKDDD
jgi:hypothetical protein